MEQKCENDLFFLCSFIEYIGRKTNNEKKYVVNKIGKKGLQKIYDLADVYHSENLEKVSDEIIDEYHIEKGNYTLKIVNNKPTFWEIGRVYQRLILMVNNDEKKYIDTLYEVFNSFIIKAIDNYDSSMYYENPGYIYESYKEGEVLKEL